MDPNKQNNQQQTDPVQQTQPAGTDVGITTTQMRKYIVLDASVSNFIDFNGWPREVMILEVKGLERAFDTDCILFDPENSLSFKYMIQLLNEKHLDYREV